MAGKNRKKQETNDKGKSWISRHQKIIWAGIAFVLGLVTTRTVDRIYEWFFREPGASAQVEYIQINQGKDNDMRIVVSIESFNEGNQSAYIYLRDLILEIPALSERNIEVPIQSKITIETGGVSTDTFHLPIPRLPKWDLLEKPPVIHSGKLTYKTIGVKKNVFSFDSNSIPEIFSNFQLCFGGRLTKDDSANIDKIFQERKETSEYYIQIRDTAYRNFYFPKSIALDHRFEDENIVLLPSGNFEDVRKFVFLPHHKISDKIVISDNYGITYYMDKWNKERGVSEIGSIDIGSNKKVAYYKLKKI